MGIFNSVSSDPEGVAEALTQSRSMSVEAGVVGLIRLSVEEEARGILVDSEARGVLRLEVGASSKGLEIFG